MVMLSTALLIAMAYQEPQSVTGNSSPVNGDTVGYWQQRVAYTIAAMLDERAQKVRASGTLIYVNNSPDTLREMYVHQYLNAFRPGSEWSRVDEREGRDRFQRLEDPDYGYERFIAPVRVNGAAVVVEYPGAPDSTVARFALPAPLAPHDSAIVAFEWEARASTLPRRQGRRGRHWDLAQWYPKVAVYDRGGWQYNALRPAGEFYGEFGTYDVTLVVLRDQIVGATGVPVSGDPGWSSAIRGGAIRPATRAYGDLLPPSSSVNVPPGFKAVRFFARDVHHFAWSASTNYRYEGGTYVRAPPTTLRPAWDTVSVHVLYRPGDDTTWGGLRVVQRTIVALQWLEFIYGPYTYPQMTVLHRLDGGGTEFPMMQMNGSPSQGLILHEGGHNFTYGILANNEWRSGWMDEGLTSYQTDWAQLFTPQERAREGIQDRAARVTGYRANAIRMALPRFERIALDQSTTDLQGGAQAPGTIAHEFRDFSTYNDMIYDRAQVMYGQLRDVLGDSLFLEFLRDYYARWALKHVDERAMRAAAERVSGRDLRWFFEQWVHRTGVMDYALEDVRRSRASDRWITEASVARRGEYRHRMRVGVRTVRGWTVRQVESANEDRQLVRIETSDEPLEVRLDPFHFSWDWDRRNDIERRNLFGFIPATPIRANFDWPFLDQADRERDVMLFGPIGWYSDVGRATLGLRIRVSYLGWLDQSEIGVVTPLRQRGLQVEEKVQYWWRVENPTGFRRPAVGWRARGASLDDIQKLDIGYRRELASGGSTREYDVTLTYSNTLGSSLLPELWSSTRTIDISAGTRWQVGRPSGSYWFAEPRLRVGATEEAYGKLELSTGRLHNFTTGSRMAIRAYGGLANSVPGQRALLLSADDPISTFENHWWRPVGAILKRPGVNWLPLGGAALRGFHWTIGSNHVAGGNIDAARRIGRALGAFGSVAVWTHAFADAAWTGEDEILSDAGLGLSLRGRFYDRDFVIRVDSPVFVSRPLLAIDQGRAGSGQIAPRWVVSFKDLW
jgi:hypothetical protein